MLWRHPSTPQRLLSSNPVSASFVSIAFKSSLVVSLLDATSTTGFSPLTFLWNLKVNKNAPMHYGFDDVIWGFFYESDILDKVRVCNTLRLSNLTVIYRDTNCDVTTAIFTMTSADLMCTPTYQIWDLSKLPVLRCHVYCTWFSQIDPCWPQMTFDLNQKH